MEYQDFDIEVRAAQDGAYSVSLLRSPAGEARTSLDKSAVIGITRRDEPLRLSDAQDVGDLLFHALISGEIRSRYDVSRALVANQGDGLRIRLRIDPPELADLPWECLYDKRSDEFLCLSRSSPLVRHLDLPVRIQPLEVKLPLRVLGMVSTPSDLDLLNVDREKQRIEEAVGRLQDRGLVELTWLVGQTWKDLQKAMRSGPWHMFHFIGHGAYDSDGQEGLIALTDDRGRARVVTGREMARLLDHPSLRLVVLNSCEGARADKVNRFSSVAGSLTRRGIPAVLAMQYSITDYAATEFAYSLYEALAEGEPEPVDAALAEARKAMSMVSVDSGEWVTPVLFMRPTNGVLFSVNHDVGETRLYGTPSETSVVSPRSFSPVPASISVPGAITLLAGESVLFTVGVLDQTGEAIEGAEVQGTVEGNTGSLVDSMFTASRKIGSGRIVWRVGDVLAVTEVHVKPANIVNIHVVPAEVTLAPGEVQRFTAYGTDLYANQFELQPEWNASAGLIDADGNYVGAIPDRVFVTATIGDCVGVAEVTVKRRSGNLARLVKLGVMRTLPRPEHLLDSVTRAQAVTLVVRSMGRESDAFLLRGASAFSDTATHWASGTIAMAKVMGLLGEANGETSFAPDSALEPVLALNVLRAMLGVSQLPAQLHSAAFELGIMTASGIPRKERVTLGEFLDLLGVCLFDVRLVDAPTLAQRYLKSTPPVIDVDPIPERTAEKLVLVKGSVSDDAELVTLQGQPLRPYNGRFKHLVPIRPGLNTVEIEAIDIAGNSVRKELHVSRVEEPEIASVRRLRQSIFSP